MKKCVQCGGALQAGEAEEQIRVGARWFHSTVPVQICAACGETYVSAAVGLAMEEQVVRWIAAHGPTSGEDLRLLRRTAELRASDLAHLFAVSEATVSHWETNKHAFDRATGATVASLALDKLDGRDTTLTRLKQATASPTETHVRLPLTG